MRVKPPTASTDGNEKRNFLSRMDKQVLGQIPGDLESGGKRRPSHSRDTPQVTDHGVKAAFFPAVRGRPAGN